MSDAGRREARALTVVCLILAASGVASGVSPTIESILNVWIGVPVLVLALGWLAWLGVRSLWSWVLIERELRRPLHPDELRHPDEERPRA